MSKDQDPDELMRKYAEKMSKDPHFSEEYRSSLASYILPRFQAGWDKRYIDDVWNHVLSSGKTVDGIIAADWTLTQKDFIDMCTGISPLPPQAETEIQKRKMVAFLDDGKYRLVTLGSLWQHLLAPLHKSIYDRLTQTPNVLRGNPLPSTFENFPSEPGVNCSGDYEASTDNLSSIHAKHILDTLQSRSEFVPPQIWDLARTSLTGTITYQDSNGNLYTSLQKTGQMMGNYLSFPLLCISNCATIICAFGANEGERMLRNGLVVVNGDDIVFRSTVEKIEKWRSKLPLSGFVINNTKTQVHRRFFTLNSKLFACLRKRVKKVWHLIPKGIFKKVNPRKHTDVMAAHMAAVRENLRGIPGKNKEKVCRALTSVKKLAVLSTSAKTKVGQSIHEYRGFCSKWKLAERIKEYDERFLPLKEGYDRKGFNLRDEGFEMKEKNSCSKEQLVESRYISSYIMFSSLNRPIKTRTNDYFITPKMLEEAQFFLYQAFPNYAKKRKEEEVTVFLEQKTSDSNLEFVKYVS